MVQLWTSEAGNGGGTANRASEGVAAILRAAEAAAADIRQAAEEEADAIRQRANEESATAAAEVARRRREVDAYAQARREDAELGELVGEHHGRVAESHFDLHELAAGNFDAAHLFCVERLDVPGGRPCGVADDEMRGDHAAPPCSTG